LLPEKEIRSQIFKINSEADFNSLAIAVFHYQYEQNEVYKKYVNSLSVKPETIVHYTQIPFLPIELFKSQRVVCQPVAAGAIEFTSSGTTGQNTSVHTVNDISLYEESFSKGFELFYGKPQEYCILALLPNYLERTGSSLVYMFDKLIGASGHPESGFYLHNMDELIGTINELKKNNRKTLLLGVTYALLDLVEKNIALNDRFIVMETGGMKGKRKEMIKEELHALLTEKLGVNTIHSEYGMTELLSQAYSKKAGLFSCPPWMRVLIRDTNDPFAYQPVQKSGGINVIDLANLYSCSFIETKDLGKLHNETDFEIIGRFDNSDIRGCNLMIH
jgi:phenylacetate-coenzyme A ligase PaaK-like adenylate-forming protein